MAAENANSGAANAAEKSVGMAQLDLSTWASQIFWLVITFGVLYFILARFILPKIDQGLTNRGDRIADDLNEAARMNRDAQQAEADYVQSVEDAKAKARNISETTRKSVEAELELEAAASEAEFDRKQEEADARIAKIKAEALSNVDDVAAETVQAIFEKFTSAKISKAAITSAVSGAKG